MWHFDFKAPIAKQQVLEKAKSAETEKSAEPEKPTEKPTETEKPIEPELHVLIKKGEFSEFRKRLPIPTEVITDLDVDFASRLLETTIIANDFAMVIWVVNALKIDICRREMNYVRPGLPVRLEIFKYFMEIRKCSFKLNHEQRRDIKFLRWVTEERGARQLPIDTHLLRYASLEVVQYHIKKGAKLPWNAPQKIIKYDRVDLYEWWSLEMTKDAVWMRSPAAMKYCVKYDATDILTKMFTFAPIDYTLLPYAFTHGNYRAFSKLVKAPCPDSVIPNRARAIDKCKKIPGALSLDQQGMLNQCG